MPSIIAGQTGTFTLDAFGYIDVVAAGDGTLTGVSRAPNLKSNVIVSRLASVRYGPYGVPMDFTVACTNGTITYTTTAGYGSDGGSGGGGGGGGDDPTDWGSFTAAKPGTVTVNGVTWTIGYTGDNITSYTVALTGADDLVVTVSYDNGYAEYSGNINVGGAVRMTAPQLRYLRDEILISAGALAAGFRARVEGASDTDAISYVVDTAGTKTYRSCVLEWDGAVLVPMEGVSRNVYQTATHASSSSESAALATVVFPGWLVKPGLDLVCETMHTATGGTSGTLTARLKVNGTEFGNGVGSAGGSPSTTIQQNLRALGSASQIGPNSSAGQTGSHSASSSAAITHSINSETTDFTITTTTQMSVADKTATMQYLRVSLERR